MKPEHKEWPKSEEDFEKTMAAFFRALKDTAQTPSNQNENLYPWFLSKTLY